MNGLIADLLRLAKDRRLIVFDMDNTIMDERRYLAAGYAAIAAMAADGQPVRTIRSLAAWLLDQFDETGRQGLFEKVRVAWPDLQGTNEQWLNALRKVTVDLPVFPWVLDFCAALPEVPMAILTNGNVAQQRNKFRQLQPESLRDRLRLYCAAEYAPKPSPAGLLRILKDHQCPAHAALMIGDTDADAGCAAAAGVPFFRVPPPATSFVHE